MDQTLAEKNGLAERLSSALSKDEFLLFYQSILPLTSGAEDRPFQEILIRFQEEEAKLLPPGTFFPLLEENGLISYVDRWVINRITKWVRMARTIKPDWKVPCNAINLSPQTLHLASFTDFVKRHVEVARLPEGTLCFELIWEDALEHAEALIRCATMLKPLGCRFTVARFEGAPGSFYFLKMLSPYYVKFAPRVVMDIDRGGLTAARALHAECAALGIQTIAEYVESEQVLSELQGIGVHHAQGFAIEAPQALADC